MNRRERDSAGGASGGWRSLLPALLLLILSLAGVGGLALRAPAAGDQVAVLFPPGTGFAEAAARVGASGGAIVRTGAFANLVVAASDTPGFAAALHRAGAWAVFDPRIAGGCLFPSARS